VGLETKAEQTQLGKPIRELGLLLAIHSLTPIFSQKLACRKPIPHLLIVIGSNQFFNHGL